MQTVAVADIMTPAESLPSISSQTCLRDAAEALKQSAAMAPVPLLVAVRKQSGEVAGILSMVDLLRGLNPKYAEKGFFSDMENQGLSSDMLEMFMEKYQLRHESLESICQTASTHTVESLLHPPRKEETVAASAALDVAIDLMVLRNREYLLVVRGKETVGVIDAASVYDAIHKHIVACAAQCQTAPALD